MESTEQIVRLLTEIRDNQREEIAWRKQVIEESIRLQRVALRWQRIALAVGAGLVILGAALIALYGVGVFKR